MRITIREMTPEDLTPGFLETLASLSEVNLDVAQARELLQRRNAQQVFTYVALEGREVVGTASLVVEQKFIHAGGKVGHIEDVAVHPSRRRLGIGTALVRFLTDEARRHGCYKCILNCFERLVPFYTRLGYRKFDECLRINL